MGNSNCCRHDIQTNINENIDKIKASDFTKINRIGRGKLGAVWKVHFKSNFDLKESNVVLQSNKSGIYAMKEFSKAKAYFTKNISMISNNRKFLEIINYNLLYKMYYAFQDRDMLYIVMDYFPGGDLRYLICRRNYFDEKEVKFIIACTLLNINYLHENNIIHRDIKPEKLLFDDKGFLHLIGFGVAFECKKGETITNASGTPGYMAPESIINRPHDFLVDYYALGVLLYELTLGERPYQGANRKEITEKMFSYEINLDKDDIPEDWDVNVISLINGLLQRKRKKRLGNNGINEFKSHPWLRDVEWDKIENFEFDSPFKIDSENNFDESYVEKQDDDSIYEGKKEIYINALNESLCFKNFYFNFEDKMNNKKITNDDNDNKK